MTTCVRILSQRSADPLPLKGPPRSIGSSAFQGSITLKTLMVVIALFVVMGVPKALAEPFAYITNSDDETVTVIDTATNLPVGAPIPVGRVPFGIAITPNGAFAYVTNLFSRSVTVIDTATNLPVGDPIPVGVLPRGIAITPNGAFAYVANTDSDTVTVIDTATNLPVGDPIPVGEGPIGIAITPNGAFGVCDER